MALNDKGMKYKDSSFSDSAVAATAENELDIPDLDKSSFIIAEDAMSDEVSDNDSKSKWKSFLYDIIFYTVLIVVCIYIIPNFIMQRTIVDGDSMKNNLLNGDHLMVEKISYHFDKLDRFDIVVFYPYGRDHEEYYVKRIIGLPGETLQIVGSDIYIDGEILEEDYGKDAIDYAGRAKETIILDEDEYFVMGDNRRNSKDSRYNDVGNVTKDNIGGRAFLRIWPLKRFGKIK